MRIDRMLRSLWGESEPPDGNRVSSSTALHEVGHLVAKQMGLPDPSSGWFGEFLAGYIANVYLLEKHPEEAQFLDEVTAGMADRIHPLHLPLDQMGNGVGGADTYIWFQVSLGGRQGEVARVQGWRFVEAARTLRATNNASLLTELESLAPGFIAWAARNHGYVPR